MSVSSGAPALVTGGAGFIGCNLADRLATQGNRVRVYDSLVRPGTEANLRWLVERHGSRIEPVVADVRDAGQLSAAVSGAAVVFHLAAQVAVTHSLADPVEDMGVNVAGTLNVLEAARAQPGRIPVIFASTNKVYGDLACLGAQLRPGGYQPADREAAAHGVGESQPLDFHSPYGCSKGAADQYVIDYARSFGVPTVVLRMSCVYGERQRGTEDQGWVAHFLIRALSGRPVTLFGDGEQVRDLLWVGDAVDAYCAAWQRAEAVTGRAFNLGGGPANAVSLRTVLAAIQRITGSPVEIEQQDWRCGDQRWFVADTRALDAALGLAPRRSWQKGIEALAKWLMADGALADGARLQACVAGRA